jgi:hypothetical protein
MDNEWTDDVQLQSLSLAELAADVASYPDEYSTVGVNPVYVSHISGQSYTFTGIRAVGFLRRLRAALRFLVG